MDLGAALVFTVTVILAGLVPLNGGYQESCHRESNGATLYVRSRNQTRSSRYTVYPGGIVFTTHVTGDRIRLEFQNVVIGARSGSIQVYQGKDNKAKLLKSIEKNQRQKIYVTGDGPSVFTDYNVNGIDVMFMVSCTSLQPDTEADTTGKVKWIVIGVILIPLVIGPVVWVYCKKRGVMFSAQNDTNKVIQSVNTIELTELNRGGAFDESEVMTANQVTNFSYFHEGCESQNAKNHVGGITMTPSLFVEENMEKVDMF